MRIANTVASIDSRSYRTTLLRLGQQTKLAHTFVSHHAQTHTLDSDVQKTQDTSNLEIIN